MADITEKKGIHQINSVTIQSLLRGLFYWGPEQHFLLTTKGKTDAPFVLLVTVQRREARI